MVYVSTTSCSAFVIRLHEKTRRREPTALQLKIWPERLRKETINIERRSELDIKNSKGRPLSQRRQCFEWSPLCSLKVPGSSKDVGQGLGARSYGDGATSSSSAHPSPMIDKGNFSNRSEYVLRPSTVRVDLPCRGMIPSRTICFRIAGYSLRCMGNDGRSNGNTYWLTTHTVESLQKQFACLKVIRSMQG